MNREVFRTSVTTDQPTLIHASVGDHPDHHPSTGYQWTKTRSLGSVHHQYRRVTAQGGTREGRHVVPTRSMV